MTLAYVVVKAALFPELRTFRCRPCGEVRTFDIASTVAAIVILATGAPTASRADSASFQGLGFLSGDNQSRPSGISDDGSVVVGSSVNTSNSSSQAFRWSATGGMIGLGRLSGDTGSNAVGVNGDGSVVVGNSYATYPSNQAFRWTAATGMVGLGYLSGYTSSSAFGVSADGSVVVGKTYGNNQTFVS